MTLLGVLADEIRTAGPISFSRYMELALYHPGLGFYAGGGAGRRKDFITSPEIGPLFGAVVARALDSWWRGLGRPSEFTFVDAGAGSGALARSILRAEPKCLGALEYVAVETSEAQRATHPDGVRSTAIMPDLIDCGVIFANELLDNLPFDIVEFEPSTGWREVRVAVGERGLHEVLVDTDLRVGSPTGGQRMRMPIQTRAARWLTEALGSLGAGRIVVIDYAVASYTAEPGREWLRTYSDHNRDHAPLEAPGLKDITADVDVAALSQVRPISTEHDQATWLRLHGIEQFVAAGKKYWAAHRAAPDLAAIAMRSRVNEAEALLDPSGLGGFTVLEWHTST